MHSINRVIQVIEEEIEKIEGILDDFGDDTFFRLASEQGGLQKILKCAKEVAEVQAGIVLKTEFYGSLEYETVVAPNEQGGFTASILDLPGCISRGKTEQEALEGIQKAKADWIENAVNYGRPIPKPSSDE